MISKPLTLTCTAFACMTVPPGRTVSGNAYMEPMTTHYHSHPAYDQYPVVNITPAAATAYCEWLTDKIGKEQYRFDCQQKRNGWKPVQLIQKPDCSMHRLI